MATNSTDSGSVPLSEGASPCIGCGLCCDGTLYERAKVAPGEEPVLTALGMQLETIGERTYFLQPCRFQSCGRCTNYEDRWTVCRSFRCALLRRYQTGEIDLQEARATIEQAFGLLAAVTDRDPDAATVRGRRNLRHQLTRLMQSGSEEQRLEAAPRLLRIVALENFLDRRFRNKNHELEPSFEEMPDSAG